jgi:uncharacterized protein YyaL (SSP411 family)
MGRIETAVTRLELWLETMRGAGGYGGPVAHWWQQSLVYTGAGLDWRYEGIVAGYLSLWQRTGQQIWLDKAKRAGDDLVAGQLENSHFAASAFELNPATGGTPHEAAADYALLLLAKSLKQAEQSGWEKYLMAAERNLTEYFIGQLWSDEYCIFRDSPGGLTFVPNKAATICEALFEVVELNGKNDWLERYIRPTLDKIIEHQVKSGKLVGAVAQNSFGSRRIEKYFPIYNARSVAALVRGYQVLAEKKYLEVALAIMEFISRWLRLDGSLPTVIYENSETSRFPIWVAPLGDVLRAAEVVRPYGFNRNFGPTLDYLLAGQDISGGIQTARGFAAQAGGKPSAIPDLRDILHVAGWCDKAFRYLASQVEAAPLPEVAIEPFEAECVFQGKKLHFLETAERVEIRQSDAKIVYSWQKGQAWANTTRPEFWLR